jgi:hypothetical protein
MSHNIGGNMSNLLGMTDEEYEEWQRKQDEANE